MVASLFLFALTLIPNWTLTQEWISNDDHLELARTGITGPRVLGSTGFDPAVSPPLTVSLLKAVVQDHGVETWEVPWPSNLATLQYDESSYPFDFLGSPFELVLDEGKTYTLKATVTVDYHMQRWFNSSFGTAERYRHFESQTGFNISVED